VAPTTAPVPSTAAARASTNAESAPPENATSTDPYAPSTRSSSANRALNSSSDMIRP
jgi:hypothetical protein